MQEKDAGGTVTATITRTYDGLDRLTQEVTPQGQLDYTYDAASRRTSMTVAGQTAVNYTYDNANRLTTITQGTPTVTLAYDDADRRTSVTYPNGNSIVYAYNAASELTSLTYKQGSTTIGDLTYTYDAAGNRIKTGGSFARSGLPPALTTVSYNANDQQTTFGTNTITYDLNGNVATVTDAGVTTTYTWNVRNQLTGISVTGFAASFTYDSFGRRTGKTVQGTTTNYVYDGFNPVQEKNGGTVTANLLTGLGIDEFFTRTDGVGTRGLLTDALGSTVALGDGTGTLQTQYTYEPFGYATQTGQANSNSYKYTGREDDGSGLHYYRARYYHPRLQRFIAEDPIGFNGGINFYGYALNNPANWIDPTGLETRIVIGIDPILGVNVGHVGLYVDNGIYGGPMIYDPSGHYRNDTRGSGGDFNGLDANWADYLKYQTQGNTQVDVFIFPTSPEEERKIAQRADILGDPRGFNCAGSVSQAIQGIGPFKNITPTILPGRLRSQLQQLQRR